MSVPRYIYEESFGEIPEGQVVRHKCDNGNCLNPEHMELGTQIDNIKDMVERGRTIHGEGKKSGVEVARDFDVSSSQIYKIWSGENWTREESVNAD